MFGLGKRKGSGDFLFDLEMEIIDKGSASALRKEIQTKIQEVKALLRTGHQQDEYDQLGILLFGYTAVIKILDRIESKIKK